MHAFRTSDLLDQIGGTTHGTLLATGYVHPAVLTQPPVSSQLLALVTTSHLALASLRNHRSQTRHGISSLTLVSLALAITPWLMPGPFGVALSVLAHMVWFVACERFAGAPLALAGAPARSATSAASAVVERQPPPAASSARASRAAAAPAPRQPPVFLSVPILAAIDETPDIKTIRIARPEGFEFEAGQFVTVRIRANGSNYARCYSISSAPDVRGYLEISIKRQGIVSNALHVMARPGAMLAIKSPNGKFTYPSNDDRPIVLLAGGVGITPLMSMLRHAVHSEPTRPVTLVYSAAAEDDFAFRDELASIARRHPQVRVFLAATREAPPDGHIYPGRIDEALLTASAPDAKHSIVFICGPAQMIESMKALLAGMEVPPQQVRHEVFQAAIAASAVTAAPVERQTSAAGAARLEMVCVRARKTVAVAAGQTLLEAAEAVGIDVPVLCRAGVCGTCRTRVISGDVDCSSTTLDSDDKRDGYVLPCVATARSVCTVDL